MSNLNALCLHTLYDGCWWGSAGSHHFDFVLDQSFELIAGRQKRIQHNRGPAKMSHTLLGDRLINGLVAASASPARLPVEESR